MSPKISGSVYLLMVVVIFSGCASVMNGTQQKLTISSLPTGASVQVDAEDQGLTPVTTNLKRKKEHLVTLSLAGYAPTQIKISRRLSGWVWGNILLGGLIGIAIDIGTGSMYKLSPQQIDATLQQQTASIIRNGSIFIAMVPQADATWTQIGTLTKENTHE